MTRAMSPDDPMGAVRPLPLPDRELGLVVDPKVALTDYARQQVLHWQICETKRVIASLRSQGYMQREPGDKWLHDGNKDKIRKVMRVLDEAREAVIVGVAPCFNPHVIGSVSNECYVAGVPCASSPIMYRYILLFKATIDGQNLAYIHPEPIFDFDEMYLRTKKDWSWSYAKKLFREHDDAIWDEQFEILFPRVKGEAVEDNESDKLARLYKAVTEKPSTTDERIAFVNAMHDWLEARGKLPQEGGNEIA